MCREYGMTAVYHDSRMRKHALSCLRPRGDTCNMQGKMTKNVERELLNHSMLVHPHVVRFEECFLTDKYLAIVMEYAAGGTLFTHVTARSACEPLLRCHFVASCRQMWWSCPGTEACAPGPGRFENVLPDRGLQAVTFS